MKDSEVWLHIYTAAMTVPNCDRDICLNEADNGTVEYGKRFPMEKTNLIPFPLIEDNAASDD
jgi:hypothetical protein